MPKKASSSKSVKKTSSGKSKNSNASNKRGDGQKKKRKTQRKESYKVFIYKVLKSVHPDAGISSKAMIVMDNFVNDMFEKLASESFKLVKVSKRKTLSSRDIQSATNLMLPGELARHAVSEGIKAVTKFTNSK